MSPGWRQPGGNQVSGYQKNNVDRSIRYSHGYFGAMEDEEREEAANQTAEDRLVERVGDKVVEKVVEVVGSMLDKSIEKWAGAAVSTAATAAGAGMSDEQWRQHGGVAAATAAGVVSTAAVAAASSGVAAAAASSGVAAAASSGVAVAAASSGGGGGAAASSGGGGAAASNGAGRGKKRKVAMPNRDFFLPRAVGRAWSLEELYAQYDRGESVTGGPVKDWPRPVPGDIRIVL